MNNFWTIVGFSYKNKVRTKSFIVTTIILMLLVSAGINSIYFINKFKGNDSSAEPTHITIGVVQDQAGVAEGLEQYYAKQTNPYLSIKRYESTGNAADDEAKLKSDLTAKTITGYVVVHNKENASFPSAVYKAGSASMTGAIMGSLETALTSVKTEMIVKNTLTEEQKKALLEPVKMDTEQIVVNSGEVGTNKTDDQRGVAFIAVYALLFLFFMITYMTGNMIAAEVTAEKSSRIMEILITSVSPLSQMFGKVMGMFLVGMTQIVVFIGAVAVNLSLPHNAEIFKKYNIDLTQIDPMLLVYGLIFYILGYFLFAVLFAAIGSMVSRTEELGQAVMPITIISLISFYIAMFSIGTPDTTLVKVASFVPFTSPTAMVLRVGLGQIAYWEIWLSIAILLVSIVVFGWISAKIYRTGVLMYGKRPSWKELRKAMKAYKI